MNSKALFLKNTILRDKLAAVTTSEWFQECLVYVRAGVLAQNPTQEVTIGANMFEQKLLDLPEYPQPESAPMKPRMIHDIDIDRFNKTKTK